MVLWVNYNIKITKSIDFSQYISYAPTRGQMSQITLFFKLQWICFKFAGTTVDDERKNLLLKKFEKIYAFGQQGAKKTKNHYFS